MWSLWALRETYCLDVSGEVRGRLVHGTRGCRCVFGLCFPTVTDVVVNCRGLEYRSRASDRPPRMLQHIICTIPSSGALPTSSRMSPCSADVREVKYAEGHWPSHRLYLRIQHLSLPAWFALHCAPQLSSPPCYRDTEERLYGCRLRDFGSLHLRHCQCRGSALSIQQRIAGRPTLEKSVVGVFFGSSGSCNCFQLA